MGRKRWLVGKLNKELASRIAESFSIDPFAALLLSERNLSSNEEISNFLGKDAKLSDPFLLPDMQVAVDRINDAIFNYEKICVYGDYDADGVTATALLYSYLEAQGANVTYLLPDRKNDGYGLSNNVVDKINALGTNLIITVDNGIAAIAEAEYIKELGMELVITDHHLPSAEIPSCVAVVDPHRKDATCPFCDYSGVGVAFMLAAAIEGDTEAVLYDFGELVAVGTVADMVPLVGENRLLAKWGLAAINAYPHPGVSALINACALSGKQVTSSSISFALGPRINAAGRMIGPEKALDLLLCEDEDTAEEIALELNKINEERHAAENKILAECEAFIKEKPESVSKPILVVYGEHWHEGVLGIVASRLLEKYLRPVIVLTLDGNLASGSARSVPGISIYDAIAYAHEYVDHFGGHVQAAGLTVPVDTIEQFTEKINEYAYTVTNEDTYPSLIIDCKLNTESLSLDLIDSLCVLEPFGAENPLPQFGLFDMVIDSVTHLGERGQHLRIVAHKEGKPTSITMMKFNVPSGAFPYKTGDKIDVVATLDKNVWNNSVKLSIILKDVRPAGSNDELMAKCEQLYDKLLLKKTLSEEEAEFALPDRQLFAEIYTYLKHTDRYNINAYEYLSFITSSGSNNLCKTRVVLLALLELGLIIIDDEGTVTTPKQEGKVDLFSAPVLIYINNFLNRR